VESGSGASRARVVPDCGGVGKQVDGNTLTEWRLRDIESGHVGSEHGCESDVRWLAFEVRRAREALLRIVSRAQDESDDNTLARDIRLTAIEALALYPTTSTTTPKSE
jgi:hypothetical protein